MNKKTIAIFFLLFFTGLANSIASKSIESLMRDLAQAKNDSIRCSILIDIGDYYETINHDSALLYFKKCEVLAERMGYKRLLGVSLGNSGIVYHRRGYFNEAMDYYNKALAVRKEIDDKVGIATIYNNIGIIYRNQSKYDEAIEMYEKCRLINEEIEDYESLARAYNNIAIIYHDQGIYDKTIEYLFMALQANEEMGYKEGVAIALNNIGLTYYNQGSHEIALQYLIESLILREELNDKHGIAASYNNIGNVYIDTKEYDKALEYHKKSLKIKIEISDRMGMSSSYTNIGNIHRHTGNYEEAIYNYLKSLDIDKEIGDRRGQAIVYNNIANLHLIIADSIPGANVQENINAALYYGLKSHELSVEIGTIPVQNNTAAALQSAYKKLGNYRKALEFAEIYISTNKVMFDDEKTKALTEMQTKYETEKQQQEIANQLLIIEKQEIDNRRQRTQRNFFFAGSVFLTLLVLLVFKGYQDKKKSNQIITEKNALLIEANEEINAQKDEIEAQHNMVIKQKDQIEIQKTKIEDSIRYARRIQSAVLPKDDKFSALAGEHFVIFRPKDVVSGDFYWATKVNNWIVIAVADCTGHGVPGAFMSMLGVSFLTEIVRKKEVNNPAQVLDQLRAAVIDALDQTSDSESQKDGMDISLLAINTENNECLWAGAGLPIWIIRAEDKLDEDLPDKIEIIKPDKMTIAISPKMVNFNYHKLEINKGDNIYMFTDGLVDQFGGPEGKKFMVRQLKQLISESSASSMSTQKEKIEDALNNWIAPSDGTNYNQIDDITIIGLAF